MEGEQKQNVKITLGMKVQDQVTGLIGVATYYIQGIDGHVRFCLEYLDTEGVTHEHWVSGARCRPCSEGFAPVKG